MASKNILKFYDNVMTQDIREHSCAQKNNRSPLKYKSVLTKRAIARVLQLIEKKLNSLIKQETLQQFNSNNEHVTDAEFQAAMRDQEME